MLDGALFVPRGIVVFVKRPGLWLLGLTPVAVSAGIVLLMAFGLAFLIDDFTAWVTPFADAWPAWLRSTVRVSIALAVIAGFLLAIVLLFAEVTNIIGQPFFEIISDTVEKERGNAPAGVDAPWWTTLPRATLESVITVVVWLCFVIPLFGASFIPFVGQTVIPVVATVVSGYFLALEILQIPLERRGLHLRERITFHWDPHHRPEALGFGIAAVLLFLVPLMNVIAMPGAIIGATLLVRRLTGEDPERDASA